MKHPVKEQCKCGNKSFRIDERVTHNQCRCDRCGRVYVMIDKESKRSSREWICVKPFKPF